MSQRLFKEQLPYRLRESFLSVTELSLLSVLRGMVGDDYFICPKVALNDIFYIQRPNENVHFYNKIFRKHVDFLICESGGMKPKFAVDLIRQKRKDDTGSTDKFMADLFLSAGLPLIHVPSSENYELADLENLFQLALMKVEEAEKMRQDLSTDSAPLCPKCGLVMVLRIHRKGPLRDKRYYGCMNAPACNGVIALD